MLISGPTSLDVPANVERVDVRSTRDMLQAVQTHFQNASIAIFAAAVADYRPAEPSPSKIKRGKEAVSIRLEPNPDILATVASDKGDRLVIGFAAETENVAENARKKLTQKKADVIVANDVTAEGAGFDYDTNVATLFSRDGRDLALPRMSKTEVAQRILDEAGEYEGMLPLLQYALKETWLQREENRLTGDSYTRSGGVREAIRNTAERTFDALSPADQQVARQLFLRLVTPGEGQEDTRARAAMPVEQAQRKIVEQSLPRGHGSW